MTPSEVAMMAKSIGVVVKEHVLLAIGAVTGRVDQLERQLKELPAGPQGIPGKYAPEVDVNLIVSEVVKQIPAPKDGKDGESIKGDPGKDADPEAIREIIRSETAKAVAALPLPKEGEAEQAVQAVLAVVIGGLNES